MGARIGVVGDRQPDSPTHLATDDALAHAAASLGLQADVEWLPTPSLERTDGLDGWDGLFVAPGSPYDSMDGALRAIRLARERDVPLIGTCGGFQHVVVEYARSVLGLDDAQHAEYVSEADCLVVTPLKCSLAGQTRSVRLLPGTRAQTLYRVAEVDEPYRCNYGLSSDLRQHLEDAGLRVSGVDEDGETRVVELPGHPFFLATLYVPQLRSSPGEPHPLVAGFLQAAAEISAPE